MYNVRRFYPMPIADASLVMAAGASTDAIEATAQKVIKPYLRIMLFVLLLLL